MKDMDPKVRRALLRPLQRRTHGQLDPQFYVEAVRRLDQRALGEITLAQLNRVVYSLRDRHLGRWDDPTRAKELVALAKALYASRRISRQEYVFYALWPVETVHEARISDGYYKTDLQQIEKAIDEIAAPKEYDRLAQRYEAIIAEKFKETLKEFGLDDLLTILSRSRDEFDQLRERGRRAVFHKGEYVHAIRDIVVQHENDARLAAKAGAFSAAVTSLGAGIEGLLLLRCLRSPRKARSVANSLPKHTRPRKEDGPDKWTFETLIETCGAAGWLRPIGTSIAQYDTASMAHVLRHMRNYIHPGRRARERPWSLTDEQEYRDANAIYVLLLSALGESNERKSSTH